MDKNFLSEIERLNKRGSFAISGTTITGTVEASNTIRHNKLRVPKGFYITTENGQLTITNKYTSNVVMNYIYVQCDDAFLPVVEEEKATTTTPTVSKAEKATTSNPDKKHVAPQITSIKAHVNPYTTEKVLKMYGCSSIEEYKAMTEKQRQEELSHAKRFEESNEACETPTLRERFINWILGEEND